MGRPYVYTRRLREAQIKEIHKSAQSKGTLHVTTIKNDDGRDLDVFRNRTLLESVKWRVSVGESKEKIAKELRQRQKTAGTKETKKINKVLKVLGAL